MPRLSPTIRWLVVLTAYMASAKLGLLLAIHAGAVTPIWPPTGIALAALLAWGMRSWTAVLAGAFLINWLNDLPNVGDALVSARLALWIAAGNTAAPLITAMILQRVRFDRDLGHMRDVWWMFAAAAAGALVSAGNGIVALAVCRDLPPDLLPTVGCTWWVGDALGFATFAPCLLVRPDGSRGWSRLWLPLGTSVAVALVVGFDPLHLHRMMATSYLTLLPLVWLGISCGPHGVAMGYVLISIILVLATNSGLGPMTGGRYDSPLVALAWFLAIGSCVSLLIGVWSQQWRRLLAEAEAGARAKGEFLATMSHELRTPLNGVIGAAELLEGDALTPSDRELVMAIRSSGKHLLSLINNILDLSRLDARQISLESVPCLPSSIAAESLASLRSTATAKGLSLQLDCPPDLPWIRSDPLRIRQILDNLLGNAVKFTENGVVSLHVAWIDGELTMTIRDSGIGIDGHAMLRLFDPFTQADASMSRRYGGSGLGLVISRRLARLLGGDISVTSIPGTGSVFTCRIAAASCAAVPLTASGTA